MSNHNSTMYHAYTIDLPPYLQDFYFSIKPMFNRLVRDVTSKLAETKEDQQLLIDKVRSCHRVGDNGLYMFDVYVHHSLLAADGQGSAFAQASDIIKRRMEEHESSDLFKQFTMARLATTGMEGRDDPALSHGQRLLENLREYIDSRVKGRIGYRAAQLSSDSKLAGRMAAVNPLDTTCQLVDVEEYMKTWPIQDGLSPLPEKERNAIIAAFKEEESSYLYKLLSVVVKAVRSELDARKQEEQQVLSARRLISVRDVIMSTSIQDTLNIFINTVSFDPHIRQFLSEVFYINSECRLVTARSRKNRFFKKAVDPVRAKTWSAYKKMVKMAGVLRETEEYSFLQLMATAVHEASIDEVLEPTLHPTVIYNDS